MLNHILRKGDRVRMKMSHDTRIHIPKTIPDGTLGTITGRRRAHGVIQERYPVSSYRGEGVYSTDAGPIVEWDEYPEDISPNLNHNNVCATDLEPADEFFKEYHARAKELWPVRLDDGSPNPDFCPIKEGYLLDNMERTGDLPETPFWELDIVGWKDGRYRIHNIDYNQWGEEKRHCYSMEEVDDNNVYLCSGTRTVNPDELTLIERGNLWKERHGEPTSFRSPEEEISFEIGMGRTEEMRNARRDNLYSWNLPELLEALEAGEIDGIRRGSGFFNASPVSSAIRFHNREIGERVRQETMKGFKVDA